MKIKNPAEHGQTWHLFCGIFLIENTEKGEWLVIGESFRSIKAKRRGF